MSATEPRRRWACIPSDVVEKMREMRYEQHMTQVQVAELLGVSEHTVRRYAPGRLVAAPNALPQEHVELIRELRYMDGMPIPKVAEIIGCSMNTVQRYAPGRPGKVSVAPLREAFEASSLSIAQVARELGWFVRKSDGRIAADTSRLSRTLGLTDTIGQGGIRNRRIMVDAETVMRIAEAIGVSPWAVLPDEDEA